jgi:hypothetical protein
METLVVECKYGWGQTLHLYTERIDLNGISYSLHDLIHFWPAYRRIMHFSTLRLELQFRHELISVRGITNVEAGLQVTLYLNRWLNMQVQAQSQIRQDDTDNVILLSAHADTPDRSDSSALPVSPLRADLVVDATRDPEQQPSAENVIVAEPAEPVTDSMQETPQLDFSPVPVDYLDFSPVPADYQVASTSVAPPVAHESEIAAITDRSRTLELHGQRMQRLARLQTTRELHLYGFDISALERRLQAEGLPAMRVPFHLQRGEVAHYCTEALLYDEPPSEQLRSHGQRRVKDKGAFILTSRRTIFQGRKRQLVLYHDRIQQVSHLSGAIMLHAEYWTRQQFFVMARPLECAIYFEHILRQVQRQQLYLQSPELS